MSQHTTTDLIGALDATTLHYEVPDGSLHAAPVQADAVPDALSLLLRMERYNLRQLWIHPSFIAARRIDQWPAGAFFRIAEMTGWTCNERDMARWMLCYHTGTYGARHLVLPGLEDRCDWRDATDARALLLAVRLYRAALGGYPYRRSPGATGTNLMRALHSGPRATELDTPAEMPPPAQAAATETPWQWIRALTQEERGRRYLHAYDRNGAFLASCAALPLGIGAAEHLTRKQTVTAFDYDVPGYWRVQITRASDTFPEAPGPDGLPNLWRPQAWQADGQWMTTPTATAISEHAYSKNRQPIIHEAYVWRQHARYLEPWYKTLRNGRMYLMDRDGEEEAPSRIALDALKATYSHSIGWLAGGWEREKAQDGHAGVLYRPDWRHAVIATANANLYRAVVKAANAQPDFLPFAINHDCIYVASDDPNAETAYPDGAFKLGRGLGQWKIVHNGVPLARLADTLLSSEPPRLASFLAALAALKKETGHAGV